MLSSPDAAAKKKGKKVEIVPSGFLGDYSDLEPAPKREGVLVYRKGVDVLEGYESWVVDRPLIYFHPEAQGVGVDPAELQMLSEFLQNVMVAALKRTDAYDVVEEPGPGVLRLRLAITDVVPIDPKKNIGTKAVGVALGVGLLLPRVDVGRAAIEAEVLDAETGERLIAVVAAREPRRFGGLIKGSKEWGDVKAAFKAWAESLGKWLAEDGG